MDDVVYEVGCLYYSLTFLASILGMADLGAGVTAENCTPKNVQSYEELAGRQVC